MEVIVDSGRKVDPGPSGPRVASGVLPESTVAVVGSAMLSHTAQHSPRGKYGFTQPCGRRGQFSCLHLVGADVGLAVVGGQAITLQAKLLPKLGP